MLLSAAAVAEKLSVVKSTVTRAAAKHAIGWRKTDLSGRQFWVFAKRDVARLRKVIREKRQ